MLRIVSDVHLGVNPPQAPQNREYLLCELLESFSGGGTVVLAGDVFEFWMEYADYIPKRHFSFLHALRKLVDSGTVVHYIAGNHDFELGQFFADALGVQTHPNGHLDLELDSKKIHIGHGDGWAPSDWKYRLASQIIRHPLSGRCFRMLHPDWGMALARWVGGASRDAGQDEKVPWHEYETVARAYLSKGADLVAHGHLHQGFVQSHPEGLYACSGDWLFALNWIEVQEEGVALWQKDRGQIEFQPWVQKPNPKVDLS